MCGRMSALHSIPSAHGDSDAYPERGTISRERDGEPGSILDPLDYPLVATCGSCGRPVRLANTSVFGEWEHDPATRE